MGFKILPKRRSQAYVAAVAQTVGGRFHNFTSHREALPTIMANLERYDVLAGEASARGAQIIVFSEAGLGYGLDFEPAAAAFAEQLPSAGQRIDPARTPALAKAASIAKKHRIVIALNMADKVPCREVPSLPCPIWTKSLVQNGAEQGFWYYGSQVALSETGDILNVYHKTHLYHNFPGSNDGPGARDCGGDGCWPPTAPGTNPATFTTSFGVTFGQIVCFDLLFRQPGAALAVDDLMHPITDFTFSTLWDNNPGLPLAMAPAIQQGWSRMTGSNLLASNGGRGFGGTGSGIYSAGATLAMEWAPFSNSNEKLLASRWVGRI